MEINGMSEERYFVVNFMENSRIFERLENEEWYDTEDELVRLLEEYNNFKGEKNGKEN